MKDRKQRNFQTLRTRLGDAFSMLGESVDAADRLRRCTDALGPFREGWSRSFGLESSVRMSGNDLVVMFDQELDCYSLVGVLSYATLGCDGDSPLGRLLVLRLGLHEYPEEPELLFRQGEVLYGAGQYASAEKALIQSDENDSETPEKHWLFISNDGANDRWSDRPCVLVASVIRSRELPDAIARLEELEQEYDDENPDLQNGLGVCHAILGDYDAAVPHFQRFIAAMKQRELGDGTYFDSDRHMLIVGYVNIAWCERLSGDEIGAAAYFGKALRLIDSENDEGALHAEVLGWYGNAAGLSATSHLTWWLRPEYCMLMLHP